MHQKAPDAINLPDANGWNAIHEASRGGHLEAVKYLVDNGADIGARTGSYILCDVYVSHYFDININACIFFMHCRKFR